MQLFAEHCLSAENQWLLCTSFFFQILHKSGPSFNPSNSPNIRSYLFTFPILQTSSLIFYPSIPPNIILSFLTFQSSRHHVLSFYTSNPPDIKSYLFTLPILQTSNLSSHSDITAETYLLLTFLTLTYLLDLRLGTHYLLQPELYLCKVGRQCQKWWVQLLLLLFQPSQLLTVSDMAAKSMNTGTSLFTAVFSNCYWLTCSCVHQSLACLWFFFLSATFMQAG